MTAKRALVTLVAIVGLITGVLVPTSGAQDGGDAPPPPLTGNTSEPTDAGSLVYIVTRYPDGAVGACTGTLVAPMWVLTAAHCVQSQSPFGDDEHALSVEVLAGTVDASDYFNPPAGVELHDAIGWIIHGNYDPNAISDDVALVKLAQNSAQPVMPIATDASLVTATGNQALPATAYGFGQACAAGNCPDADVLRTGPTEIVSDDAAEDFVGLTIPSKAKRKNVFMLPNVNTQAAVCFGDSGGPLTVMQGGVEMVAAVNSFIADDDSSSITCSPDGSGRYLNASADVVATGLHDFVQEIINAPTVVCFGLNAVLVGSSFPDKIIGTFDANVMAGRGDDDLLIGFEGDDTMCGGSGDDTIIGGSGDDDAKGNGGSDIIDGDDGNDRIRGGGGDDELNGGRGADNVKGGGGDDDMNGNGGGDTLKGGGGDDVIRGKKGNDTIKGGGGDDDINGNGGTDSCSGGSGANTIRKCES